MNMFKQLIKWLVSPCKLGHDWHTAMTSATYSRTGPLPGESHGFNGLGQGGYRYERHCRCCDRLEYARYQRDQPTLWQEFHLPPGETYYRNPLLRSQR